MFENKYWNKLAIFVNSIVVTLFIVLVISLVWTKLEEIYLGYINNNPVDTIITIMYTPFIYYWAREKIRGD